MNFKSLSVLVLGGTRQMGLHLVNELLAHGYDVTLANRGIAKNPFGDRVKRLYIDRNNADTVKSALNGKHFDLIVDCIAYSAKSVKILLETAICDKYIQFSSNATYKCLHFDVVEAEYNPAEYNPAEKHLTTGNYLYQVGKREAEHQAFIMYPQTLFLRMPFVGGLHDKSHRLGW